MRAAGPAGTIRKPSGLKPQAGAAKPKASFTDAAIKARLARDTQNAARRGGIHKHQGIAGKIYESQLRGTMQRGKGAALPRDVQWALQNARSRKRPDGSLRFESAKANNIMRGSRPSYGAPVGGSRSRITGGSVASTVRASTTASGTARARARVAQSAKLDPFQRSEAASAKRRYGVHSTISNPGRRSTRSPRVTTSTGSRVAVTGRSKSQISSDYQRRISNLGSSSSRRSTITRTTVGTQFGLFGSTRISNYKVSRRRD